MTERFKEIYNYEADLDIDKEWAAIEAKMDKKRRRRFFPFWLFGGLVFIVIGTMYYLDNGQEVSKKLDMINSAEPVVVNQIEEVTPLLDTNTPTSTQSMETNALAYEPNQNNNVKTNSEYVQKQEEQYISFPINDKLISISEGGQSEDIFSEIYDGSNHVPQVINDKSTIRSTDEVSTEHHKPRQIAVNDLLSIPLIDTKLQSSSQVAMDMELTIFEKRELPKYYLCPTLFYGGSRRSLSSSNKSLLADLHRYERPLHTRHIGLMISRAYKDNIWSTGLLFGQHISQITFEGVRTSTEMVPDELLTVYTDARGVTNKTYGDEERDRKVDADVNAYNKLSYISVPVIYGRNIDVTNSLSILPQVGISFQKYTEFEGINFNKDGLLSQYNATSRAFTASAVSGIDLVYGINSNLKVVTGIQGLYSLNATDLIPDVKASHSYLGGNVSFLYQLVSK